MASKPGETRDKIEFGEDFEFDLRAYQLRQSGRVLKLEPTPMELLLFLVEHKGELITRDQIVEKIWGEGVSLDADNSINGAIRKIRQALKDSPEQPRFVQTITGKGYRFIAPVTEPRTREAQEREGDSARAAKTEEAGTGTNLRKRWTLVVAAIVAVPGVTWQAYEAGLESRLADLHSRVHRGAYRALPSKRVYIEKGDGRKRPLGIGSDTSCCDPPRSNRGGKQLGPGLW
jgi:DNA-binding winged helix-turn-helix (wHTH) protein